MGVIGYRVKRDEGENENVKRVVLFFVCVLCLPAGIDSRLSGMSQKPVARCLQNY